MGRIIEGSWNCSHCGKKDIKARYKECPQCGHPQDKNTHFEMKDPHNYVSEEVAQTISRKPKWECSFCGRLNFDEENECASCGATKDASERNYFMIQREKQNSVSVSEHDHEDDDSHHSNYDEGSQWAEKTEDLYKEPEGGYHDDRTPDLNGKNEDSDEENRRNKSNQSMWQSFLSHLPFTAESLKNGFLAIGALLLVIGMSLFLFMPRNDTLHITGKDWERSIAVEAYRTVDEDDWSLPANARLHYTNREIHHYDRVLDHYETIKEEVPERYVSGQETYVSGHRAVSYTHLFDYLSDDTGFSHY